MKVFDGQNKGQSGTGALRWVVAGTAVALLAVVAGFVTAGRLRMKNYLKGLPARLGVDIEQETNNFTYSQSKGHRKIFTVHAAKEVQHKGGTITLHDVGIVLYGPTGEETDRIHGTDFEYNPKAQTLTARGEVYIDLVPPEKRQGATEGGSRAKPGDLAAREIHVKTMGLVFDQAQQTATTDGAVEFQTGGYMGQAVGASYDAEHGVVVLESAVRMSGLRAGRPVTLTAARAEMDRLAGEGHGDAIDLQQANYVAGLAAGHAGVAHSFAATHAVVRMSMDGTPERVDAEGEVTLAEGTRGRVRANRLEIELGPDGQAKAAHLYGAVRYEGDDKAGKREHGTAEDARVGFDAAGRAEHAAFAGGSARVEFVEETSGGKRKLDAARIEVGLGGGGKEPVFVRTVEASGAGGVAGARLVLEDAASSARVAKGRNVTEVRADRLVGAFAPGSSGATEKRAELTGLDGAGHSWVQRISYGADGSETAKDTSAGDVLRLEFEPYEGGRSLLKRGELRGGVTTVYEAIQMNGAKKGTMSVEHGRANDAVFEQEGNVVHLTGKVEVQDETSAVFADKVDVDRSSGDAIAVGSVKVSDAGNSGGKGEVGAEPLHVVASRAVAHKSTGMAEFFADGGAPVRLWQGTSQVEAPEVDFYRREKRVVAKGSDVAQVKTVLAGTGQNDAAKDKEKSGRPVRILSRQMVYTDAARTVEFTGGVKVLDADGTMTAKEATVWLVEAPASAKKDDVGQTGLMDGKVDHIVANGGVVLTQPGRKGTGEKLAYTAADGIFVLTGTAGVPPKVVDVAQGSTTGAALRFHSGDDSVEVLGSDGMIAGRVRSETRMRQ